MVASHGARSRPGSTVDGRPPRLEERLLSGLLGQLRRAELIAADRIDQPAVFAVDGADRVGLARAKARELVLGQHPDKDS